MRVLPIAVVALLAGCHRAADEPPADDAGGETDAGGRLDTDTDTDTDSDSDVPSDTDVDRQPDADGPVPPCEPPAVDTFAPTVLWSEGQGSYDPDALFGAFGPQGALAFADQDALDAFLAAVSGPAVAADFEGADVMALWYVTTGTCSPPAHEVVAWWDGDGVRVRLDVTDASLGCCDACDAFGHVLVVVALPEGGAAPAGCVAVTGGCADETDACL